MLKYILPILLLGFTACELNEDDILKSIVGDAANVPEGTYISQCVAQDVGFSRFTLVMSADSYTIQEDGYSNELCDADEALGTPSAAIAADLPGPDLGDGFSVFTNSDDLKVPYFYDDGQLVIGDPQESLPSGDDDFSGFQEDFEAGRIAIYMLQ